jgi:hypothetical protein
VVVMSWRPVLYTQNVLTGRWYRLSDDRNRQWFSHYTAEGSGFGYLSWKMRRPVGFDWPDIGYAFPIELRKGPYRVLFAGQIVKITERSGRGGDEIEVWALGWIHVAGADVFNRIYCDTRLTRWTSSETPEGSFRPDLFDWDTHDGLYFKPRRGVDFAANDYAALHYAFPFGETAMRFVADYDVALPNGWPGKLEVRDGAGTVLWSANATGTGSIDLTTTGSPTSFEVRFYCTAAGENTAADDTVYGKLSGVRVYSVNVSTLDVKVIADDVVTRQLSAAGHGLSADTGKILAPGRALEPAAFDSDRSPLEVLRWCCQFGDGDGNPLAFGVTFDETCRLFLEPVDLATVCYVIRARPRTASLERGGDWGESAQVAYGIYADDGGEVQRTADRSDGDVVGRLGGFYRRTALQLSGVTSETQALQAVDLWLAENAHPTNSGSFEVRGYVLTPSLRPVPVDEVVPGGLIQVREWRALEATLTPADYRDRVTTFPLAGVRVSEDDRTAELIPRATSDAFARQMAVIAELVEN